MSELTTFNQLSNIAFGFIASKALFTALHVNLFTHLSGQPKTLQQLVEDTGVAENRLSILLTALLSIGLLVKQADCFANAAASDTFLVQGARHDFSDYLRFQIDQQMYPFLLQLDAVMTDRMTTDQVASYAEWMDDPKQAELFSLSQHSGSLGPGRSFARRVELNDTRTLLDVGGGTGAFAIALCEQNPNLRVTVLDFPHVVCLGERLVQQAGLAKRITFIGDNALTSTWPSGQDAVLMSYLLSGVPGTEIPSLARHAYQVLNPGGRYLVHDFMVYEDHAGPPLAALWHLQHLAFTPHARSTTSEGVKRIMQTTGFHQIDAQEMIPADHRVSPNRCAGNDTRYDTTGKRAKTCVVSHRHRFAEHTPARRTDHAS
jgi:ubiquinone/menaquinone biosynthesis C-methylase UbiE